MCHSWKGLCSEHENYVVIRELSLYPQSLLAKLTVLQVYVQCVYGDFELSKQAINCVVSLFLSVGTGLHATLGAN